MTSWMEDIEKPICPVCSKNLTKGEQMLVLLQRLSRR